MAKSSINSSIAKFAIDKLKDKSIQNEFIKNLENNSKNFIKELVKDKSYWGNIDDIIDKLWRQAKNSSEDAIFDTIYSNTELIARDSGVELTDLQNNNLFLAYIEKLILLLNEKFILKKNNYYEYHECMKEEFIKGIGFLVISISDIANRKNCLSYKIKKQILCYLNKIFNRHQELIRGFLLFSYGVKEGEINQELIAQNLIENKNKTLPEVFIIESLSKYDTDEKKDGKKLYDLLRLSGKKPKYFYINNKNELKGILELFKESKYRFLHISCHASLDTISLTDEDLKYSEFTELCKGKFNQHRIFFSACDLGNELFVNMLGTMNKGQLHSIIAPKEPLKFHHAAAIWSTFYLSIFEKTLNMNSRNLKDTIQNITKLFPVKFRVATYNPSSKTYKLDSIE